MEREMQQAREYEYQAEGIRMTVLCGVSPLYGKHQGSPADMFHTHSWQELFFALEDTIEIHTEADTVVLHPGEAILVPPGKVHYAVFSSEADKKAAVSFFLQQMTKSELAQKLQGFCVLDDFLVFRYDDVCRSLICYLSDAMEQGNRILCGTYLTALLLNCLRCCKVWEHSGSDTFSDGMQGRIYKIEQAMFANYTGKLSLKQLAEELNLSERQVSRVISRHYGSSYREKNKQLRMQSALRRLQQGESIQNVASSEGYKSLSAFYAAFRSTFGMTPAEYKKSLKQTSE